MATGGNVLADSGNLVAPLVYAQGTFTPTVTLVGGANNVVPQYTTSTGRYTRVGNRVFVDIHLTGDGGNEGAGTGQLNIALPFAASASNPAALIPIGDYTNNAATMNGFGEINGAVSTVALTGGTYSAMTGANQNATDRMIRLQFSYEV